MSHVKSLKEDIDVIVVGAGISGLVSACYLANKGKKVRILESHSLPGGYLQTYKRKGYNVEAVAAVVPDPNSMDILREVFEDLEIRQEWIPAPIGQVIAKPGGENVRLRVAGNPEVLINPKEGLKSIFVKMLPDFTDEIDALVEEMFDERLFRENIEYYKKITFGEFLSKHLPSEVHYLFYVPFANPTEKIEETSYIAFRVIYQTVVTTTNCYPKGGWKKLIFSLVDRFIEFGGTISYSQRVTGFDVVNGKITGVKTKNDHFVSRSVLVCGSPYPLLSNINGDISTDSKNYLQLLSNRVPCLPSVVLTVYFKERVISSLTETEKDLMHGMVVFQRGQKTSYKGLLATDFLYTMCPTYLEPSLSTTGDYFILITTVKYYDEQFWRDEKNEFHDHMVNLFCQSFPSLRKREFTTELATPLTMEKFTLNYKGAISGWAMTPDQVGENTLKHTTPWENLFLAGHWVFPGPRIPWAMESAKSAVYIVNQYLDKNTSLVEAKTKGLFEWASREQGLKLESILEEILEIPLKDLTETDSFLDYDIESIKLIRAIRAMNEEFDINLKMGQIFTLENLGELSNLLKETLNSAEDE